MIVLKSLAQSGILFPDDVAAADPARVGGKAAGLARLRDAGCNVPPWFVVTPNCNDDNAVQAALARLAAPQSHPETLQCRPELVEGREPPASFAVRSSAHIEDGATTSCAGRFATLLFVSHDGVPDAIRRVRASGDDPMPVIVQRMIDGTASGVAFGIDPVDGSDVVLVTAAPGLASAVVDGDAITDTWRVTRDGAIAACAIADKDRMHVRAPHGGTLAVAVDAALKTAPALDDDAVRAVASLARRIANAAGAPQDVEFTFARGTLWALQARPVTAVAGPPVAIWDDSNIAESYGGIVGALTYSFARHAYAEAYRAFFRLVAVPRTTIDANAGAFDGLVGRVEGRMMYDLVHWYRILALLPGYRLNRRLMEEMMGVREALPAELADAIARESSRGPLRDAAMLAQTAIALVIAAARLPRDVARFHAHVDTTLAGGLTLRQARDDKEYAQGCKGSSPVELVREYRRLERALLERWNVPIANDFFVMLSFGLLKRAAEKWCGDASLAPALLSGNGGMLSAEPARAVQRLAALDAAGDRHAFETELSAYLERFGDRCESELKLESSTLRDDPRPLLEAIARLRPTPRADHVPNGVTATATTSRDEADQSPHPALRVDAEERARAALRTNPVRAFVFARLTAWTRARVVARENLRFERTRVFGRVRRIVVALGEALVQRGALDDARDVFHLTINELLGFVEGTAACRDLRGLAAVRRAESARYAVATPPPNRFATRDLPVAPLAITETATHDDAVRSGTPCCPGIVRGHVRVVRDPRETLRRGEILVTERTDPSWVVLFPAASAILVERGSQLSHAAIVSREMGIPSVVAIRGLMAWLHDGDLVELDGATGVVRRVEETS